MRAYSIAFNIQAYLFQFETGDLHFAGYSSQGIRVQRTYAELIIVSK